MIGPGFGSRRRMSDLTIWGMECGRSDELETTTTDGRGGTKTIRDLPELASNSTLDGLVDVSVFKDDERCVPSELEREFLEGLSGLSHEDLANRRLYESTSKR